jgi:hypothetical protein
MFLIALLALLFPVEKIEVGQTVYATAPHVRLREAVPSSLAELNYGKEYIDPAELWIVREKAPGVSENPHERAEWLHLEHTVTKQRGWAYATYFTTSADVVYQREVRHEPTGVLLFRWVTSVVRQQRDNIATIFTVLGALFGFLALRRRPLVVIAPQPQPASVQSQSVSAQTTGGARARYGTTTAGPWSVPRRPKT